MNLKSLSDEALLEKTKSLVARERQLALEILHHLKEIDSRKLYLEIGYPSLWEYCTKELGYAEGSAQRRIEAMRALREMPALERKIESGALTIVNVAKVQSAVRRAKKSAGRTPDKVELFRLVENKTQKEADQLLAERLPESVISKERVRPINETETEARIILKHELIAKLETVKSLFSHQNANPTLAETIEMMAEYVIAKKAPQKPKKETEEPKKTSPPQWRQNKRRAIPAEIKRQVWQKAEGACEYTDPKSGRRCGGRHKLEIDHIVPKAEGGSDERENLRLYCRAHNVLVAEQMHLI